MTRLEELQDRIPQATDVESTNVTLIDGGLLFHSVMSGHGRIVNYGTLARNLLVNVCSNVRGDEIHILFDTYSKFSLKSQERECRGGEDREYTIDGRDQAPGQSPELLLRNGTFKNGLAKFLQQEWQNKQYGPLIGGRTLYVSHGLFCVCIKVDALEMAVTYPQDFHGTHEEADTLIAFHVAQAKGDLIVRACDTDVLIILLGMVGPHAKDEIDVPYGKIIMDCGLGNSRRYIDVSSICANLDQRSGRRVCLLLY